MALTKQQAVVPFAGGIETSQNEFLVAPPNLLSLSNGVFRKEGEISKRYGFTSLSKTALNEDDISVGNRLDVFNDDLVLFTGTNLYSYGVASKTWYNKGAFASVSVSKDNIVRNRFSQTSPSICTVNGTTLTAWEDERGGVRYNIIEDETGSTIVPETSLGGSTLSPICVTLSNRYLVLLYVDGSTLKSKLFNPLDFSTVLSNNNIATLGTYKVLDAVAYSNRIFLAYNSVGDTTRIEYLEISQTEGVDTVTGSTKTLESAPTVSYASQAIAVFTDPIRNLLYVVSNTGTQIRLQGVFQDLNNKSTENVLVEAVAAPSRVTGIAKQSDGVVTVFWEIPASPVNVKNHYIKARQYTYNGASAPVAVAASAITKRSVGIASHAFEENGTVYLTSGHESELQPTYFVLEIKTISDAPVAAKILASVAGGHPAKNFLPRFLTDTQERRFTSLLEITRLSTEEDGETIVDNTGVVRSTLNFVTPPFQSQQLGQNLLIAGGFITAYDGAQVVEHGFHLYPEDISYTTGVGTLPHNDFRVTVIYEWSDSKGQIHRSAPAIPLLADSGGANSSIIVTAPTLRLSSKQDVKIVLYATNAGLVDVFYRVTSVANNPAVDTVTLALSSNTNLTSQEILYTTGGIVEHIAAPAAALVQTHQNRMFIAGLEDENELRYSKESVQNEGVAFSDFFRIRVNPKGGGITALGTLDDKLIIFKEDTIFALTGQGPVDTGAQNDFQQPEQISSQFGCISPSSVVTTAEGLLFASKDGIKLLTRGLIVQDVGDPMQEYNNLTVSSGILLPAENEVRFVTKEGEALVYNFNYKLWSTFKNYQAISAVRWNNSFLHLKEDGTVNQEIEGSYRDNGYRIPLSLSSPWLNFNSLMGYKRVYQIMVLGKRLTNHAFHVNISYDYNELTRQVVYFNTVAGMLPENYTPDSGVVIPSRTGNLATGNPTYQFRIKPTIQRCEAIKLVIEDIPLQGELGAGYTLAGLNFLLGVDSTRQQQVPAAQTVGE